MTDYTLPSLSAMNQYSERYGCPSESVASYSIFYFPTGERLAFLTGFITDELQIPRNHQRQCRHSIHLTFHLP